MAASVKNLLALREKNPSCIDLILTNQKQLFMKSRTFITDTAKNNVISPDFLVWKFCGKAQFSHSFGRFARYYAETMPFRKISTPAIQVNLWYFTQWDISDFHALTINIMKLTYTKGNPKIKYRDYKNFDNDLFQVDLENGLRNLTDLIYTSFEEVFLRKLDVILR